MLEFNFDPGLIKFFEDGHRYEYDGQPFLSVTQILRQTGFIDTTHFSDGAARRGTYVHEACVLVDEGDLARNKLHPTLIPYVSAYERFLKDTGFRPILSEFPVAHPIYRYAGTLDRVGKIKGRLAVIDIKTGGAPAAWTALQTAAYSSCLKGNFDRYALQLKQDGKYALPKPYTDKNDARVFCGAAAAANWQRAH